MGDFGLLISQYNSTLPTLADGDYSELQVDSNGRLLVQADVTVVMDFLGLNGAADSSNVLIVGTEDGTDSGTAHAFRLTANGSLVINDGGGSITVDGTVAATQSGVWNIGTVTSITNDVNIADGGNSITVDAIDLDIRDLAFATDSVTAHQGGTWVIDSITNDVTVDAVDLDIRDLTHATDSVKVGDGTDFLAIEADGSINVNATSAAPGSDIFDSSDDAGDGELPITGTYAVISSITVGAGTTAYIYGYQFDADENAQCKLVVRDSGADANVLKVRLNSSSMPGVDVHFAHEGRIEITGAANRTVDLMVKTRKASGSGTATGSIHARLV